MNMTSISQYVERHLVNSIHFYRSHTMCVCSDQSGVSVRSELADVPLVRGDRVELQQVMLNLILNAVEAMSGIDEGEQDLLITTGKNASRYILVSVRYSSAPASRPSSEESLHGLPNYETERSGSASHLPIDCRETPRMSVGERQYPTRRGLSIHSAF